MAKEFCFGARKSLEPTFITKSSIDHRANRTTTIVCEPSKKQYGSFQFMKQIINDTLVELIIDGRPSCRAPTTLFIFTNSIKVSYKTNRLIIPIKCILHLNPQSSSYRGNYPHTQMQLKNSY